jgi:uroporphyrinogen-III synthase
MSPLTIALFRGRADALRSAQALSQRGLVATLAPVVELAATGALPPPEPFDFLVATSAKAIELASPEALAARTLYVVGERTAAAARRLGLAPQVVAADIAALIPALPNGRALYLAGRDRKPDLEAALAGASVLIVYEARARAAWDEAEARAVERASAAVHYSERSAALAAALAEAAGIGAAFRRLPHVCLSRAVAAPLARLGVRRALWPATPQEETLLDVLESALADHAGL